MTTFPGLVPLGGHGVGPEAFSGINISSVIVGVASRDVAGVRSGLAALDGVELHAAGEDGRMIVTIETASEAATLETFAAIRGMPGVLSVSLAYHQFETDPDEEV